MNLAALDDFLDLIVAAAHPFLRRPLHLELFSPGLGFDRLDCPFILFRRGLGRGFAVRLACLWGDGLDFALIFLGGLGGGDVRIVAVIGFMEMAGFGLGGNLLLVFIRFALEVRAAVMDEHIGMVFIFVPGRRLQRFARRIVGLGLAVGGRFDAGGVQRHGLGVFLVFRHVLAGFVFRFGVRLLLIPADAGSDFETFDIVFLAAAGLGLLFGQQRLPVGDRDLVIIGMDFREGEEALAVAAILHERRLKRGFHARHFGEIDIALERPLTGGLEIKFLDLWNRREPPRGFLPGGWRP